MLVGLKKRKFPVIVDDASVADSRPYSLDTTFKASSVTGPALYYLGIVDFLQDWTFAKRVERAIKIYIMRKDPDGLSVMEPLAYMERFQGSSLVNYDLSFINLHYTTLHCIAFHNLFAVVG